MEYSPTHACIFQLTVSNFLSHIFLEDSSLQSIAPTLQASGAYIAVAFVPSNYLVSWPSTKRARACFAVTPSNEAPICLIPVIIIFSSAPTPPLIELHDAHHLLYQIYVTSTPSAARYLVSSMTFKSRSTSQQSILTTVSSSHQSCIHSTTEVSYRVLET